MGDSLSETFWLREASRVRRRINLGWWIERLNWLLLGVLLVLAPVVIWFRTRDEVMFTSANFLILLGSVLLVSCVVSWLWSRGHFIGSEMALVRLDDRWGMDNRLVSAAAGRASWPSPEEMNRGKVIPGWKGTTALAPAVAAILAVSLSWFVPLPESVPVASDITSEPGVWEQMDEWIETLDSEELIEPESLQELADQIEELRDQPNEEWFSHSSLEASDTLKDSFGRDLQELAQDLAAIERSLEALETFSTELSEEGREMLMRELSEALESLTGSGLALNESLAEQLRQLDPSSLSEASLEGLSSEQMQQLREQLRQGAESLGSLEGLEPLPGEGEGEAGMLMSGIPGTMPGNGEIQRGRGDAPIFFGDQDDLKTNRIEAVSNDDLSRASIGDVIGVGETEHEKDKTSTGMQEGGAVGSAGSGGDAVWKDSLLPDEQAVLKRYFK